MYCVCIVSSGNQYPSLFFLMFDFWYWMITGIAWICSFNFWQFIFLCFSVNVETGKCNAKCHFWSLRQCMRKHQVCACVCACMEIFYFFPCLFFYTVVSVCRSFRNSCHVPWNMRRTSEKRYIHFTWMFQSGMRFFVANLPEVPRYSCSKWLKTKHLGPMVLYREWFRKILRCSLS